MRFLTLLALLFQANIFAATGPSLQFAVAGKAQVSYGLDTLKAKLTSHHIALNDTQYHKPKNYRAFALKDLLDLGYGKLWRDPEYSDMAFLAADGYEAVSSLDKMAEAGGYLAYEDIDVPGWELVGQKQANPGPFYLVWVNPGQTTQHAYPWPWQVVSLNLVKFADQYPNVYPQGVKENSLVFQGFKVFKGRCVRCHAIDRQGGKIGPDLAAPQNILDYRDAAIVKAYIRQPSKFRYTEMPDHTDLTGQDLDNLVAYFQWQQNKRKPAD